MIENNSTDIYSAINLSTFNSFLIPLFINCQDEILSNKPYVFNKKSTIKLIQAISKEYDSF